jgi:hypothetical protein
MSEEVVLEDEIAQRLKDFKKIFDAIMEEELDFNDYVNVVISLGLDRMFRDAIPEGEEWRTLTAIFKEDSKYICDFVSEVYKKGEEINEEKRKRMKEVIETYIR